MKSGSPAKLEVLAYGELPAPTGPTGSICHTDCPAAAHQPANACAAGPRSPTPCGAGSDERCRSVPARRRAKMAGVAE